MYMHLQANVCTGISLVNSISLMLSHTTAEIQTSHSVYVAFSTLHMQIYKRILDGCQKQNSKTCAFRNTEHLQLVLSPLLYLASILSPLQMICYCALAYLSQLGPQLTANGQIYTVSLRFLMVWFLSLNIIGGKD